MLIENNRKIFFGILLLLIIPFILSAETPEGGYWETCKVVSAGPTEGGNIMILLESNKNTWDGARWFNAHPSVLKEMLAVAMAAIISEKEVTVNLVDINQYATIKRLYLKRN